MRSQVIFLVLYIASFHSLGDNNSSLGLYPSKGVFSCIDIPWHKWETASPSQQATSRGLSEQGGNKNLPRKKSRLRGVLEFLIDFREKRLSPDLWAAQGEGHVYRSTYPPCK